jgi:methyl-accepting chemotaxis protein
VTKFLSVAPFVVPNGPVVTIVTFGSDVTGADRRASVGACRAAFQFNWIGNLMNTLNGMKLGTRLGVGFGTVLLLMAIMIAAATARFGSVGESSDKIITKDWVKADAAANIYAFTRANGHRVLELVLTTDKGHRDTIRQRMEENKKQVTDRIELLDKLIYSAEGKALLAKVKDARASFAVSFGKVDALVASDKHDEAMTLVFAETMPALDVLLGHVTALAAFQKKLVELSGADIKSDIQFAHALMLTLGLAGIAVGVGVAWWLTRSITRQLGGEPEYASDVVREISAGNLTVDVQLRTGDTTSLLAGMKAMRDSLAHIVGQVRQCSDSIAAGSSQIATGNADLSQRTEEQAANLEETAASMEQLTSTVKNNADTARQATQLANSASAVAAEGGVVVGQVVGTMEAIAASSKKIVDIISVIDSIAFQTNILALNAAVEAARAGEQGRGFAVVAGEVRSLAQRSASAAKEIKGLITDSVEKVEAGSLQVGEAGRTMSDIVAQVKRVNDLIGEISSATQEQTQGINQVGDAVSQLDQVTQQNAALVEESSAAADSLNQQAKKLVEAVSVFTLSRDQATSATDAVQSHNAVPIAPPIRKPVQKQTLRPSASGTPKLAPSRAAMAMAGAGDAWEQF